MEGADGRAERLRGEVILIATGSLPNRSKDLPLDDEHLYDSDTILQMDRIPRSLAVIGAGVIGCEYASIFAALGVEAHLLDGRDRLLPFLDGEISQRLKEEMERRLPLTVHFGERPTRLERTPEGIQTEIFNLKSAPTPAPTPDTALAAPTR